MPEEIAVSYCPDELLAEHLATSRDAPDKALVELDSLIRRYARDPRLLFLKGSFLAGTKDYTAARIAMRDALDLAPDFDIARFQLGFLQLTCGEPVAAQETWGPLHGLAQGHYLHHFVLGLCHLIRDEFGETIYHLEKGIDANSDNPPLNGDMRLIAEQVRGKMAEERSDHPETSSAQALLQQAAWRSTMH